MVRRAALLLGLFLPALVWSCSSSDSPNDATRTAVAVTTAGAAYRQTPHVQPTIAPQPTSTPVVFTFDHSATPAIPCPGCLVAVSFSQTLAVNVFTGDTFTISELPPGFPPYAIGSFGVMPSPNGRMFALACNDDGSWSEQQLLSNICLWGAGTPLLPVVRASDLARPLTLLPGSLVWSPDGRYLVFSTVEIDNNDPGLEPQLMDTYLHDTSTGTTTLVARGEAFEQFGVPVWSPAGDRFAISRIRHGIYGNLLIVDAANGATRLIPSDDLAPALDIASYLWSPDGGKIAFTRSTVEPATPVAGAPRTIGQAILVASPGVSDQPEPLPISPGRVVDWSSDGAWLLIQRETPPATGTARRRLTIAAVRADGTGEHILGDGFLEIETASFSPDGQRVAFLASVATERRLFVTSTEGGEPLPLPIGPAAASSPTPLWSLDGDSILYTTTGSCGQGGCSPGPLFAIAADGSSVPRQLTEDPVLEIFSWAE